MKWILGQISSTERLCLAGELRSRHLDFTYFACRVHVKLMFQGARIVAETLVIHDAFFKSFLDGDLNASARAKVQGSVGHG